MRIAFQERPWDLYVCVVYGLVVALVLLATTGGNVSAIPFTVFLPGYVLLALVFPKQGEISWALRLVLGFALSIVIVSLLGLILDAVGWGIGLTGIVATITIFIVTLGAAAYVRRVRLPSSDRLSASIEVSAPDWNSYTRAEKAITVALAAGIVLSVSAIIYYAAAPTPGSEYTEFYVLGPGGTASGYPTRLNVSQPGTVLIGITNHEVPTVSYTVRVDIVGVELVYNATTQTNETVEVNRTTWSWFNVTLREGQNWIHPFTFSILAVGLWKVQFLLFKNGDFSIRYRQAQFYVGVN